MKSLILKRKALILLTGGFLFLFLYSFQFDTGILRAISGLRNAMFGLSPSVIMEKQHDITHERIDEVETTKHIFYVTVENVNSNMAIRYRIFDEAAANEIGRSARVRSKKVESDSSSTTKTNNGKVLGKGEVWLVDVYKLLPGEEQTWEITYTVENISNETGTVEMPIDLEIFYESVAS